MIISNEQLLAIASEQMAGMQAPGYLPDNETASQMAIRALHCARRLAYEAGFAIELPTREVTIHPDRREAGGC